MLVGITRDFHIELPGTAQYTFTRYLSARRDGILFCRQWLDTAEKRKVGPARRRRNRRKTVICRKASPCCRAVTARIREKAYTDGSPVSGFRNSGSCAEGGKDRRGSGGRLEDAAVGQITNQPSNLDRSPGWPSSTGCWHAGGRVRTAARFCPAFWGGRQPASGGQDEPARGAEQIRRELRFCRSRISR